MLLQDSFLHSVTAGLAALIEDQERLLRLSREFKKKGTTLEVIRELQLVRISTHSQPTR